MSDNTIKNLLKAGAVIGGAWLAVALIKSLAERVYHCPNCNGVIEHGVRLCPHCQTQLTWRV